MTLCVLTGDYRGATFGPFDAVLEGLARARTHIKGPVYGVLGNHDSNRMVPELEEMGIRILLNECEPIPRGDEAIYLAGIDDTHYYRLDNIEKAAAEIPDHAFSICCRIHPKSIAKLHMPVEHWRFRAENARTVADQMTEAARETVFGRFGGYLRRTPVHRACIQATFSAARLRALHFNG
jgi:hypothetical protein